MLAQKATTWVVVALRREHSEWPCSRIAAEVGVSTERVRQILKRAGLATRQPPKLRACIECKVILPPIRGCARGNSGYCSDACKSARKQKRLKYPLRVNCTVCGVEFDAGEIQMSNFRHGLTRGLYCPTHKNHGAGPPRKHPRELTCYMCGVTFLARYTGQSSLVGRGLVKPRCAAHAPKTRTRCPTCGRRWNRQAVA